MSSSLQNKKAKLREESDKFEESLNEEFSEFSEKAIDLGGKILVIGGGALLSYLIVKSIVGKEKNNEFEDEQVRERIIVKSGSQDVLLKSLSDKVVLVLLELLREIIVKFLKKLPEKDND